MTSALITAKRNLMPMTQHWHIARNAKYGIFAPFVIATEIIAVATKEAADYLQRKVFFSEARK